jgi:hypothetical protein
MCQYLVVQYTMKHQKYGGSILFYSTRTNIRNMFQYLVVQYPMKHPKYVSVSSSMVHGGTSEIGASI